MPYIATNPGQYENQLVGSGQCVDFVKVAANAPATPHWKQGATVKGLSTIAPGTAIATFVGGKYLSHKHGNHAAIYIRQDAKFLYVWDQWKHGKKVQPVHQRQIAFGSGKGPSDDGNAFSVIEPTEAGVSTK